ncbi:MAG: MopE-related protein [Polyangiaceae bacterium]
MQAFSGQVHFGLATFPRTQTGCSATCFNNCTYNNYSNNNGDPGCGSGSGNTRKGAYIRVPMLQDAFWQVPPPADNTAALLSWVDNSCTGNTELFADGFTPLNGMLRDLRSYFSATGWTSQDGAVSYPTPLAAQDLAGAGVNGSTACRPVNIIFVTDGGETCDPAGSAVAVAQDLYQNGVTVSGKNWKIRTYMINFAGGGVNESDAIAAAGGTSASILANNETELSLALSNIIASAVQPETCDNTDNNCNGCTDEGFKHYCNVQQTCCTWMNTTERNQCLANYTATITAQNPNGDLTLLPCTTIAQKDDPASWLCYDPKETCDNVDNNCSGGIDEGVTKCGNPAACPTAEVCDGIDNDCDGVIDDGVCSGCVPSPEICDGCDNDCDGLIDEGIASVPCGQANPPNCVGQLVCAQKPNPGGQPGICVGGGFNTCSNNPQTETCDGLDNDCDGIPDDGVAPTPCVPAGTPAGLNYGPNSQCKMGSQPCGSNTCIGFVGPSAEVCDGLDNDCDGIVDENVFGINLPCGLNQAPCTPGLTACVNGALVCQGGVGPQPEVCDGIDNNCNGQVDDAPLADAPPANMNGCWNLPGNCCTFGNLSWCPPAGAGCNDVGSLTPPCNKGTLVCNGGGWICQGSKAPGAEVCDGADNDCDGLVDEAPLPQVGEVCGTDVGECQTGVLACVAGTLDCQGDVPPSPELCDALDNDCDGTIDNGIPVGGTCTPDYDPNDFPNPPVFPPCQPGTLVCDANGNTVCDGGVGPTPEVCDGIDNDCDGQIDEPGPAPNGIDGSADPNDPTHVLGDMCGDSNACGDGIYVCLSGFVVCQGSKLPEPESCDCEDNDCNGMVDDGPGLCSAGKDCVASSLGCQCAEPCGNGEIKCPGGQECIQGTVNGVPGNYCFPNPCPEECGGKTVTVPGTGEVECAPLGTPAGGDCIAPPVCVCKGQPGCHEPCFGVTCSDGKVCTSYGAAAGTCVTDNCYNVPCQGCDTACHSGSCIDNPCVPNPCAEGEVCKPSADFTTATCTGSCAGVSCPSNEVCVDGQCTPTCDPKCTAGQVCDPATLTCIESKCTDGPLCSDGSCCDPLTGNCGDCPCSGVVCPSGQQCQSGQCILDTNPGTGGGGTGGAGGGGTGGTGGTGGAGGDPKKGGWGLATGGGGCSCRIDAQKDDPRQALLLAATALALTLARRRRRTPRAQR